MRARKIIFIGVLVLVGVVAARGLGLWVSGQFKSPTTIPTTTSFRLSIADGKEDFGTAWDSSHLDWILPIRNDEPTTITVESVGLSCSCISLSPKSFTIKPGEVIQVRLIVNLAAKRRETDEAAFELFPVARVGDGPTQKLHWTIRGRTRQFVRLDEPLSFGRVSAAASVFPPIVSQFTTVEPLPDGFDVQVSHPAYTAAVTAVVDQPTRHHIRVDGPTDRTPKEIALQIVIRPRGEAAKRFPATTLTATGQIVRDVSPSPANLLVGGLSVGELTVHKVSLVSLSGSAFRVLECETSGEDVAVVDEGGEIRVSVKGTRVGSQNGHVRYRVRAVDGDYDVLLPISYTCVEQ